MSETYIPLSQMNTLVFCARRFYYDHNVHRSARSIQPIKLIGVRDLPGQVVICGYTSLTTPAMQTLLNEGIPVVFLSAYGRYQGTLTPQISRNALLRVAQHQAANREETCLDLAKAFVDGKCANMRLTLQRRKWKNRTDDGLSLINSAIQEIADMRKRIPSAENLSELLGVEGNASASYFRAFGDLLKTDTGFDFQKRSRRPPADATNSLLSFAYSLLTADVLSAIQIVGLDPYVGFFHQLRHGRPCLALDLMEEFRSLIADSVVLTLINTRRITPDDFNQANGGWFLKPHARKRFYAAYEKRKNDEVTHPVFKYKLSFRRALELQARLLAKYLTGEIDQYTPLRGR